MRWRRKGVKCWAVVDYWERWYAVECEIIAAEGRGRYTVAYGLERETAEGVPWKRLRRTEAEARSLAGRMNRRPSQAPANNRSRRKRRIEKPETFGGGPEERRPGR